MRREVAGICIPFVAGIYATEVTGCAIDDGTSMSIAFITVFISAAFLIYKPTRQSRYARYIAAISMFVCGVICRKISMICECSTTDILSDFAAPALRIFTKLIDSLPFVDESCNSFLKALLCGDRSSLPEHITKSFRESGASHILALSGLHLGIIYMMTRRGLSILGNNPAARKFRSAATILLCCGYTILTGAGSSLTRALIFVMLNEAGTLINRSHELKQVFYSALLIQLTMSPSSSVSLGFQLSYAAMAGIVFIYPVLRDSFPSGNPIKKIWSIASMSIACQITTAPLVWIRFHTFPPYFLITNLICIPLTGVVIPASTLTLALHSAGICPEFIYKISETLILALLASIRIIAGIT